MQLSIYQEKGNDFCEPDGVLVTNLGILLFSSTSWVWSDSRQYLTDTNYTVYTVYKCLYASINEMPVKRGITERLIYAFIFVWNLVTPYYVIKIIKKQIELWASVYLLKITQLLKITLFMVLTGCVLSVGQTAGLKPESRIYVSRLTVPYITFL